MRYSRIFIISLFILIFIIIQSVFGISGVKDDGRSTTNSFSLINSENENFIIFISPQYKDDVEIFNSLNQYKTAVKNSLGWNVDIIKLNSSTNKMDWIDKEIERLYNLNKITAVLMVGEDIKTPLFAELHGNQESPLIAVWADTNSEINDYQCNDCSCCRDYTPEVAISLMYPNSNLAYSLKKQQIVFAFNKFSKQNTDYGDKINLFMSEEFSTGSGNKGFKFSPYSKLYLSGNINVKINPNNSDITNSLNSKWKIYAAEGHADPSRTIIKDDYSTQFYSNILKELDTALYLSNGCFTSGWFTNSSLNNNKLLDLPITSDWYGNYVLTNPSIRTEFNGGQGPDFTYCASEMIAQGKTMAEIYIKCDKNTGGVVMFGDPTLRFKPFSQIPASNLEIWGDDLTLIGNPKLGMDTKFSIKIRNTGNLNTHADVYVYDATDKPELMGYGNTIYYSKIDGRTDLEICKTTNIEIPLNSYSDINCTWKPKKSLNNLVIRVFDKDKNEIAYLDNGNEIIVIAN